MVIRDHRSAFFRPRRDSVRFLPLSPYGLWPTASGPRLRGGRLRPGTFLRDSGFLRQYPGVEKRLYMVK